MAIKLSPKGKEEIDQSQEKGVLGKVQARAQGGQGESLEDRHGTASKLFLEAIEDSIHAGAMWARSSSSEWYFAQKARKMSLMAEWLNE